MSTKIQDLASQIILGVGAAPQTATATVNGTGGDMQDGDGRCFAIQHVGAVSGTSPTLAGKIQESTDNSTWTDIAGATFTTAPPVIVPPVSVARMRSAPAVLSVTVKVCVPASSGVKG